MPRYATPKSFPASFTPHSLSGKQAKIGLVEFDGKFYVPGRTPFEHHRRWEICEDIAKQIAEKCIRRRAGDYAHLTEQEILDKFQALLLETGWGSEAEMQWIMQRVSECLEWSSP